MDDTFDPDYLKLVFDDEPHDAVDLCERISQRWGDELTLDEAQEYLDYCEDICSCHFEELGPDGYCAIDG